MSGTSMRRYLVEPGEAMFLPVDSITLCDRIRQFIDDTALDAEDILVSPILGIPLPIYLTDDDGELLPWTDTEASMLWHPLFWLPRRVALRQRFQHDDGSITLETEHEWAARVLIELDAVGLYNAVTGEWGDILAEHGIDVDDPEHLARVRAWQGGAEDGVLDAIDLTSRFDSGDDALWAYSRSRSVVDAALPASWNSYAAALLRMLDEHHDEITRDLAVVTVAGALVSLSSVPDQAQVDRLVELWEDVEAEIEDPASVIDALARVLSEIEQDWQPAATEYAKALASIS